MNKLKDTRPDRLYGTRTDGVYSVSGIVHVIRNEAELPYVREGEIIVAEKINPEWKDQLALAKAIIEDVSASDSEAASIAGRYEIPATIAVTGAMELRSGDIVTMYGDGEIERVYEKRAPDSPMRVSVPAAVEARKVNGFITATNVVPFSSARKVAEKDNNAEDTSAEQTSNTDPDNQSPANG